MNGNITLVAVSPCDGWAIMQDRIEELQDLVEKGVIK